MCPLKFGLTSVEQSMKKILLIIIVIFSLNNSIWSQVGIGAGGGGLYPGLRKSDLHQSQFILGGGFDFFVRHTLSKLGEDNFITARYSYRNYFNDIDLPRSGKTRFIFNYLSVDVSIILKSFTDFDIYGGAGISLIDAAGEMHFTQNITETVLLPELLTGVEYKIGKYFNLFGEFLFQIGSIEVQDDVIHLTGFRFMIGGTMFLIN